MPASLVALQILLILLPGFAAAYLVQMLATRRSQTGFERVIEALLLSFVIYITFVIATRGRLPFRLVKDLPGTGETIAWEPAYLGILAAITFGLGVAAVGYMKWDGNRIFRWLRLTERTTRN